MQIDKSIVKEYMSKKQIATQTELAQLLGITKNQLSVMLSPKFNPIKSNVLKLCKVLGVSPMEILEKESTNQAQTSETTVAENNSPYKIAKKIKTIELFAGGGGLALGLEQAGLESVALMEINKYACETLKYNRPHWNVMNEDVTNVDFSQFEVDAVIGGFPCQAFSYAGKKLGFEDTRGTLFFEFARAVKETRPKLFLAENVRGIISHDNGRTLKTIIQILSELGYNVEYRLVNAVNYGVPQKRERVIIIGTLDGFKFRFPREEKEIVTLKEALKDVPPSEGMKYSDNRKKILELVPPGGCWRDLPIEIQKDFMGKSFYSGGGRTGMARRLSWDEPSLTLTTSPSQKQTERCHPDETRPFTVREYARIQTFPDSWEFQGSMSEKYKQIGNAVPVKLAYKLGQSIVECLTKKRQNDSIEDLLVENENHQLALSM